jgi:hypothetical protein
VVSGWGSLNFLKARISTGMTERLNPKMIVGTWIGAVATAFGVSIIPG